MHRPINAIAQDTAEARLKRSFAGTRVLVAEDDPVSQEISCWLMECAGFAVDLAEDGLAAVTMANQMVYDLILMDIQMPNLNGIDATKAIRGLPGYGQTPILAVTANTSHEDRYSCLTAGMNDHIAKPICPDKLYEAILKWLSATRAFAMPAMNES